MGAVSIAGSLTRPLPIVALCAGFGLLLFGLEWLVTRRGAPPGSLLRPLPVRIWRSFRWFWFRIGLGLFSWPHVFDVVMGTGKAPVAVSENEVIWSRGTATLRRYGQGGGEAVLVVHSLVSKPWILDLAPGRSLLEFLVNEGFDAYLLDWGDPSAAEASRGLSACTDLLMEAEKEVMKRSGRPKMHLVGYCLGGLLCLLRAGARTHSNISSIVALATPVDFTIRVGLQPLISRRLFKPAYFLDATGCVPAPALRESFHILRPQALRTVIGAWKRRKDLEFRHAYDPLARWVWEHRPLSGQALFDLVDLFRSNALLKGQMVVSGELARLQDVRAPVLTMIASRDHIVPSASSYALKEIESLDLRVATIDSGHVSMISGSAARDTTWPTVAEWIRDKS